MTNDKIIEKRSIKVSGTEVTVFTDGSVEKLVYGKLKRQIGGDMRGYRQINIGGDTFQVHRLVAMAFLPDWNENLQVDHVNGERSDNRLSNLRMVTPRENQMAFRRKHEGASSKFRGVSWHKRTQEWYASIKTDGNRQNLGCFTSEEDAAKAYNSAAIKLGFKKEALNAV